MFANRRYYNLIMLKLTNSKLPNGVTQIRKAMINVETKEVVEYPIEPPFLTFDFSRISQTERDNCENFWEAEYLTAFDAVALENLYYLFRDRLPIRVRYQGVEYFFHSVVDKIDGDGEVFYPVILSLKQ